MKTLRQRMEALFPSLRNPSLDTTSYEGRRERKRFGSATLIAFKIAQFLILFPLYFLCLLPWAILGLTKWPRLAAGERSLILDYCRSYWYYPALCIHKVLEGRLFRNVLVSSPSIDIGCEDGSISRLHFPDATFDVGVEYIRENAPVDGPYREVVIAGLPSLPAAFEGRFATVSMIHVIDHIADLDASLAELHRITKPGGDLTVSGFASGYLRNARTLSMGLVDEDVLGHKKGFFHFLEIEEWRRRLEAHGFDVKLCVGFLNGFRGLAWTLFHSGFEINGSNDLLYAWNRVGLARGIVRPLFIWPACLIVASFLKDDGDGRPVHFFAVGTRT